jgi:endonuclease/exonuclease/phosphatase family metal-dependent hydrolase
MLMVGSVTFLARRRLPGLVAGWLCSTSLLLGTASAQTTVVLNQTGTQVTDTTIRNGAYKNTNCVGATILTRNSAADPDWERRAILKFDTANTILPGSKITSAKLTLTLKSGLGTAGQTRPVNLYRISSPFQEAEATWMTRQGTSRWGTAGGDMAEQFGSAAVSNVAGTKVTFDVTNLVQQTSDGKFDSRYTRIGLIDVGSDVKESYREYYSSKDVDPAKRPTLTVVIGGAAAAPPPPPPPPSSGTLTSLKVMQWNLGQRLAQVDNVVAFIVANRPDIVSFNEINHYASASADMPKLIADKLTAQTGETWSYKWVQKLGAATGEGECVMTRLPVDATNSHLLPKAPDGDGRSVAMLRVMVNGRTIDAFSTHLENAGSDNTTRVKQVDDMTAWALAEPEQRIIAGDFNGWPGTAVYNEMIKKNYVDSWVTAKNKGVAVTYAGNPDGNTKNTRIDYVWYSKGATALSVTRAQVFNTSSTISDHRPVIVTFQVN